MVKALVQALVPLVILTCSCTPFEAHKLRGNILQEVLGKVVCFEVVDAISRYLVHPAIAEERTQRVATGSGVVCEACRRDFWNFVCVGNELDQLIHDHVGSCQILQLVGQ